MSNVIVNDENLTNIANAIREKNGETTTYLPSEMASAIQNISSGGNVTTGLIINASDSDGYATDISIVGMNEIPAYYFNKTILSDNIFKNLVNLQISDDCTYIQYNAFDGCVALQSIKFPSGLTGLSSYVFNNCSKLGSTELPNGITTIGNYCFYNCQKLVLTEIPVGVTSLGERTFYQCISLQKLNFLGEISRLGYEAFYYCSNLEKLIFSNVTKVPTLDATTFKNSKIASGTGYIYVPDDLVDSFKTATNWSTYADQIKPISELEVA